MYLKSDRLVYEKFKQEHFEDYYRLVSQQPVMQYITGIPLDYEMAKMRFKAALDADRGSDQMGFLAVFEKDTGSYIGLGKIVAFEKDLVEIGYALLPEYWGKGYASEITCQMVRYARKLGTIKELIALVAPENAPSIHVLTKQNFTFYRTVNGEKNVRHDYILQLF